MSAIHFAVVHVPRGTFNPNAVSGTGCLLRLCFPSESMSCPLRTWVQSAAVYMDVFSLLEILEQLCFDVFAPLLCTFLYLMKS